MWELEGDFDSESESWDSAPQAPRSKETGAPQARGTSAPIWASILIRVWTVFFNGRFIIGNDYVRMYVTLVDSSWWISALVGENKRLRGSACMLARSMCLLPVTNSSRRSAGAEE